VAETLAGTATDATDGGAPTELLREAEAAGSAVVVADRVVADRVAAEGLDMPVLLTGPRDRAPAGALEALDDSLAVAPVELPESAVEGSA
jgi:hypothetical protein